jgi:hypothetical protein
MQDGQCKYIVTLRRVHATIVAVEKQYLLHILSLRCPACNATAPYCHMWLVRLLRYFSTLSHEWHGFRKNNLVNHKMDVFILSTNLSETFIILRRTERDMIQSVCRSSCKYPLLWSDFNEIWILPTDFRKIFKYQVHKNPFSWSPVVPCGQTDRPTWRS